MDLERKGAISNYRIELCCQKSFSPRLNNNEGIWHKIQVKMGLIEIWNFSSHTISMPVMCLIWFLSSLDHKMCSQICQITALRKYNMTNCGCDRQTISVLNTKNTSQDIHLIHKYKRNDCFPLQIHESMNSKEGKQLLVPLTPALTHASTLLNTPVCSQRHFQFVLLSSAHAYS